jgi:hypothetical protein
MTFCIFLALSLSGESRANTPEQFKTACLPKCAAQGHAADFCGKFCTCNATETQKKFGDKALAPDWKGTGLAAQDVVAVPAMCNARYIEGYFETMVAKQCGKDADCALMQRCIAKELKGLGSEAETAAVMSAVMLRASGKADATKLARFGQVQMACTGRNAARSTENGCLKSCGNDAVCTKSCSCLGKKIAAVGNEFKIGEFMTRLGAGDAETAKRHKVMLADCGLQAP